jgi:hypothetical protein
MKNTTSNEPAEKDPTSHPIATGVGASAGAAAGVALGSIGGPVGSAIGGTIGAIVGGVTGSEAGAAYDAGVEEAYWRDRFHEEPYYERDFSFDDYAPAYRLGGERYGSHESFEAAEKDMGEGWDTYKGSSRLTWDQARPAARAGWHRLMPPFPPI